MHKYTPQIYFYWKLLFAVPHCLLIASCMCSLSGDQCFSICLVVWRNQKGLDFLMIKQSLYTTNSLFIFVSTMRCLSIVLKHGSVCMFRHWNNRIRTLCRPNVAKIISLGSVSSFSSCQKCDWYWRTNNSWEINSLQTIFLTKKQNNKQQELRSHLGNSHISTNPKCFLLLVSCHGSASTKTWYPL